MEVQTVSKYDIIQGLYDRTIPLSHTALSEFAKSPGHFIAYKLREKKDTPTLAFGRAVHCFVLEPDSFDERFAVAPKVDRRTKEGKATWADFVAAVEGKEIIEFEDMEAARSMADAIYQNEASRWVLDRATRTEVRVEWQHKGFPFVGYVDGMGDEMLFDLKTIADASPRKVERAILYEGYARQAAHYTQGAGYRNHRYFIIAVDRACNVTTVELRRNTLLSAWEEVDRLMVMFKKCLALNEWDKSYDFWIDGGIYEV